MTLACVTGAFGYSGRAIARRLLDRGDDVRTLTRSVHRESPFGERVKAYDLVFDDPAALDRALQGVDVLVNTYWVRFSKAGFSQTEAVENSKRLFAAAAAAGVSRVVHVSITNPSPDSPYEYFRGKAAVEDALRATSLPHSILRPAVFFGGPDVLLNNIAWLLRHFPVFGLAGDGSYRLQPIHVEDFAALVEAETLAEGDRTLPAIGPETWAYRDLVEAIGRAVGHPRPILPLPRWTVLLLARALGAWLGDVLLTSEELDALMDDLLAVEAPPTGRTALGDWLRTHGDGLGLHYANEVGRRRDRRRAYERVG
jgi:NADH dehydrogenase